MNVHAQNRNIHACDVVMIFSGEPIAQRPGTKKRKMAKTGKRREASRARRLR